MIENVLASLSFYLTLVITLIVVFNLDKICGTAAYYFTEHFTTSIEIQTLHGSSSNVSKWLLHLVEHNCGPKLGHFRIANDFVDPKSRKSRLWSTKPDDKTKKGDDDASHLRKQLEPIQISRSISFFYKKKFIRITRKVDTDCGEFISTYKIFKITAYGTTNKQFLIDMVNESRKMVETKPSKHINYYTSDQKSSHSSWRKANQIKPRTLSSITLKDGITDAIQKDLQEFIESKEWYKDRGIPYRRGYLLYGPPGCGKTSFVKAIAGQIGYNIYEMQLSKLNDDALGQLMSSISRKAILLFEDADAVFVSRVQDEERSDENDGLSGKLKIRESKTPISFSGLLNAIDGVASVEDYIIFMTTNRIEKLDSALIRPGRIDMRQLINYPDEQQIVTFFKKFYPGCEDDVATKFAKAVVKLSCNPSVAQIQGLFLKHKHVPEDNLLDVDSLIEVCKDNADLSVRNIYL